MYIMIPITREGAMAALNSVPETSSCSCIGPAPTGYRCDVIARTALDVVSSVGGRLVDLAMAGWEVTAVLADCSDPRPLRILGATVVDLDWPAGPGRDRIPQVLMVAADLCGDDRVRRLVQSALGQPRTQLAVWGGDGAGGLDAEFGGMLSPTQHRLSAAGRAFKVRALMAARRPPLFEPTESYWAMTPEDIHIHSCI